MQKLLKSSLVPFPALLLCFLLFLPACSAKSDDIVETSYKSLQTSATLGYAVLASASELHDQGLLSDEAFFKVHAASQTFYNSYMAAIDVLYVYAENKDETGKQKLLSYIDMLRESVNVLLTVAEGVGLDLSKIGASTEGFSIDPEGGASLTLPSMNLFAFNLVARSPLAAN